MVKYSCERCGKGFSQKSHYDSHNRRKTPCENNADKIKILVDKSVEEKLKELNNKNLFIQNEEVNINTVEQHRKEVKYIDLFCGLGAFHTAFNRNNILQNNIKYTCVLASDINDGVRNIYEENYGIRPHGDITKVDVNNIPDFDILTGGFPCQSFSNSGKKGGFTDKRGQLYENILAIALVKKPSYMFLENVKHIKKIENGDIFKQILFRINETGYHVETFELSPHQLGVPQQRERILFVCIRTDIYDKTKELDMTPPENVFIDVDGILEKDKDKTNHEK